MTKFHGPLSHPNIPDDPGVDAEITLLKENRSLDNQIQQMQESILRLRGIKAVNNRKVNRTRDPFARLPLEVVSQIFLDLRPLPMELGFTLQHVDSNIFAEDIMTPLVLCGVCRAWRTVAGSLPRLWTTIAVNIFSQVDAKFLQQWFERSGNLPVDVYLYIGRLRKHGNELYTVYPESFSPALMDVVNQHSERWLHLNVDIPKQYIKHVDLSSSSKPMLQLLTLHGRSWQNPDDQEIDIGIEMAPNLTHVHVSIDPRRINLDWAKINVVQGLRACTIQSVLDMLSRAPALAHLTLDELIDFEPTIGIYPTTIFTHRGLTSLSVVMWSPAHFIRFSMISFITLPALQHLTLVTEGGADLDPLREFLLRSSCTLTSFKLIFEIWDEDVESTIEILKDMPSLNSLVLLYRNMEMDWSLSPTIRLPPPDVLAEVNILESAFLPNLMEVFIDIECLVGAFYVELDLGSDDSTRPPEAESSHLEPTYLYHLLNPNILLKLNPQVTEDDVDIDPVSEDLSSFGDFFCDTITEYTHEPPSIAIGAHNS
ncbi:hypothetical protein BDN70DRAFT_998535 [Pholiota conissans]|uniref:F-box domain-containing protein n=1 Tax=Pholiota conissans TaxID=109636 RepID=A0A9P6CS20_9AGAR|nr:hypothetical protein BDN70DRAFT_998535 [Pholiota conissans]